MPFRHIRFDAALDTDFLRFDFLSLRALVAAATIFDADTPDVADIFAPC